MKFVFFGTGTSRGVPEIGSNHPVSFSKDPKNIRLRSSGYIISENKQILIDCGPDFRQQMLIHKCDNLDAVLITHEHFDHTAGLDDLRPINYKYKKPIPIYAEQRVVDILSMRNDYMFSSNKLPGLPQVSLEPFNPGDKISIGDIEIECFRVHHAKLPIIAFRIGKMVYITDANYIDEIDIEKYVKGCDILIVNAVQHTPHFSHFCLPEVEELAQKINPKMTYITHISEKLGLHEEAEKNLPDNIRFAYDGLSFEF